MAIPLLKGETIEDLDFTEEGMVLVLKSNKFNLTPAVEGVILTRIPLYNSTGDILLEIVFRKGRNMIFVNDRASKAIGKGWGKPKIVDLGPGDVDKWRSGITISVHHRSTASGFGRYQILFGLTTICYFDKRFPGGATQVKYQDDKGANILQDILSVCVYEISDLQPEEQEAIESGRAPSHENLALNTTAISIRSSHFIPNQTYASISWDEGKEIRTYHLGRGNVLHEYAYSESKKNGVYHGDLHHGDLHKLNIILEPTSSIAAVRRQNDGICIFFQDPTDGSIQILKQDVSTGEWQNDPAEIARAVKGSSIAVVMDNEGPVRYRVFYQDPELHLREHFRIHSSTQWRPGFFNPGVQPRGTLITAEVVHGGDVDINVTWRDARGCVASGSWSKSTGWDLPNSNGWKYLDGHD